MTTATHTPFVEYLGQVGVVEASDVRDKNFCVRFEDGSRFWVGKRFCTLNVEQPSWYREPETCEIAGWVR
jgi:hypothetical protein